MESDGYYLGLALEQAREGLAAGEVPVGAVLVDEAGEVLARAFNRPIGFTTPRPTPRFWPSGKGPGSGGITGCRGYAFMLPWNLASCAWEP